MASAWSNPFVREDHEKEKFNQVSKIYQDFSKAERILAFQNPLMQFAVCLHIDVIMVSGQK